MAFVLFFLALAMVAAAAIVLARSPARRPGAADRADEETGSDPADED